MSKNEYVIYDDHAEIVITRRNGDIIRSLLDLDDVDKCRQYSWSVQNITTKNIYIAAPKDGKHLYLHRYVMNYEGNKEIDHINRNALDNRKQNLRIVSSVINAGNIEGGIRKYRGRYYVRFTRFGQYFTDGSYKTKEEAVKARDKKLEEIGNRQTILEKQYFEKFGEAAKGISLINKQWMSSFTKGKQNHYIGLYKTKEEAIKARTDAYRSFLALDPNVIDRCNDIPVSQKYIISIEELAKYAHISKNTITKEIENNPDAKYLIWNGKYVGIKRRMIEERINMAHTFEEIWKTK